MGPTSIGLIVTVYMAITLLLDVPAGVLADRWGKKPTLMLAIAVFMISDIVLGVSTNLTIYLLGTAFWGFFTVLFYGTYEALLYDTAKHLGRKDEYEGINARQQGLFMLGVGVSSLLSGFISTTFSLQAAYFLSIIPLVVAMVLALRLREPPLYTDGETVEEEIASHWQHLVESFRKIFRSPMLRHIAMGMLIVLTVTTALYEFGQYVYIDIFDGDEISVGLTNGTAALLLVAGFAIASKVKLSISRLVTIVLLLLSFSVWQQNFTALVAFLLIRLVMPIVENRIRTQVQHAASNNKRATMTSAINFLGNIFVVPFVLVFGIIAEHYSVWLAYGLLVVVVACMLGYYFIRERRLAAVAVAE